MFKWLFALFFLVSSFCWASPASNLHNTAIHVPFGSGAYVKSPNGQVYVLTNWHVCSVYRHYFPDTKIPLDSVAGTESIGMVVKVDPAADLCVLRVFEQDRYLAISDTFEHGDKVYTLGWPKGKLHYSEGTYEEDSVIQFDFKDLKLEKCPDGFVSFHDFAGILQHCVGLFPYGITDLYSQPGSSGSPVVNSNSQLVGVMQSAVMGTPDHRGGGIIPLFVIKHFMESL